MLAATLLSAALHAVWALFLARDGGDLAAQSAWTYFVGRHPGAAYNLSWYGGVHPASYSVLSPYVMSWFGIRTVAVIAGTLSATMLARLLVHLRVPALMPAALWGALATWCNAASGRVTFGLGLVFALAAVQMAFTVRGTPPLRAAGMFGLSLLATLASPVAGLFIMVVAAALFLTGRRRAGLMLALAPPLVVGVTTVLFPFTGVQPIGFATVVLPAITSVVAVLLCAPREWTVVRVGAGVYLLGIALTWLVPSPIGSNVERLSLLFGGVVLLTAVARTHHLAKLGVLCAAFIVTGAWMVVKPVDDVIHTRPANVTAANSGGLKAELDRLGARRTRIEVVPLRSHWESAGLTRHYILARGWNRQVDAERHALFYEDGALTPASYHAWLRKWSVGFVVLPEQEVEKAGKDEAALIERGQPYLRPVWSDDYWRLYRVADPVPLVALPSTVARVDAAELAVDVPAAGVTTLRIAWSPWLNVRGGGTAGHGCLERDGDFVRLHAPGPGRYTVSARYGAPRGTPCPPAR
ncbi:MFS transporter [Actinomadura sp. PM05-2]|uniref:MFS transporter n=1 Tax=Actinomadura parmotrematis TaxID=2864039 RepID=A0ABS7FKP9_9ACTN|nr:MFS transporter [Actinomadura parmotrematis]